MIKKQYFCYAFFACDVNFSEVLIFYFFSVSFPHLPRSFIHSLFVSILIIHHPSLSFLSLSSHPSSKQSLSLHVLSSSSPCPPHLPSPSPLFNVLLPLITPLHHPSPPPPPPRCVCVGRARRVRARARAGRAALRPCTRSARSLSWGDE